MGPIPCSDPLLHPFYGSIVLTDALVKNFENSADVMIYKELTMVIFAEMKNNICVDFVDFTGNSFAVC